MARWLAPTKFAIATLVTAVTSAWDIIVNGWRIWHGTYEAPVVEDSLDLDYDELAVNAIAAMGPQELADAMNEAMYIPPGDDTSLFPEWFIDVAREGLYLAGVQTMGNNIAGVCVVRVNDITIGFDCDMGGWHPVQVP